MCSVNGALSGTKLVTCGIPQGSILGPLLFLIYINDLPNSLEYSSTRMFADDTTLTVSGKSIQDVEVAINHDLTNVKQWLTANRLSLNLVKTEYLLIGSRYNINNLLAAPNVFVGDTPIKKSRWRNWRFMGLEMRVVRDCVQRCTQLQDNRLVLLELLAAKARLAKKGLTISRLELVACQMVTNLVNNTSRALCHIAHEKRCWSDSTVALWTTDDVLEVPFLSKYLEIVCHELRECRVSRNDS
ncbi:Hypothetical predicted protein [Paramuricea clavata]|uniref:Uncharacterized protein n=1 Tax=Paramuricea clavata TaxID=317549 RepID=A0A7D9ETN6_PARCT|nr:Hypothetical predicted protein [Paramuricea clavata]